MQAAYSPSFLLVLVTSIAASSTAYTQEVALPAATETPATTPITTPARGALMTQVEAKFGAPTERHGAIGNPPITRWDYPGFSVFFEHQHVIHAVVK